MASLANKEIRLPLRPPVPSLGRIPHPSIPQLGQEEILSRHAADVMFKTMYWDSQEFVPQIDASIVRSVSRRVDIRGRKEVFTISVQSPQELKFPIVIAHFRGQDKSYRLDGGTGWIHPNSNPERFVQGSMDDAMDLKDGFRAWPNGEIIVK